MGHSYRSFKKNKNKPWFVRHYERNYKLKILKLARKRFRHKKCF